MPLLKKQGEPSVGICKEALEGSRLECWDESRDHDRSWKRENRLDEDKLNCETSTYRVALVVYVDVIDASYFLVACVCPTPFAFLLPSISFLISMTLPFTQGK